jgi:hypothetical protein
MADETDATLADVAGPAPPIPPAPAGRPPLPPPAPMGMPMPGAPPPAEPPINIGAAAGRGFLVPPLAVPPPGQQGAVIPGNIDVYNRPVVTNPDGSVSTVRTMGINDQGFEVNIPTVSPDGRILTDQQAEDLYRQTGAHLGKFRTVAEAERAAQALHQQQGTQYAPGMPPAAPAAAPGGLALATKPPIPTTGMGEQEALMRQLTSGIQEQQGKLPGLAASREQQVAQRQQIMAEQEQALGEKSAAERANLERQRAVLERSLPELKEERAPEYQRPIVPPQQMQETMGMMALVAGLFGMASRTPFMGSMQAMTGAMTGWQQRDDAMVEQSMKEYQQNLNRIQQNNNAMKTEWEAAKASQQNDIEGLMIEAKILANTYDLPIAQADLRFKSAGEAISSIDKQIDMVDKAVASMEKLQTTIADNMATHQTQETLAGIRAGTTGAIQGKAPEYPLPGREGYDANAVSPYGWTWRALDTAAERFRQTGDTPKNLGRQGAPIVRAIAARAAAMDEAASVTPAESAEHMAAGHSAAAALTQAEKQRSMIVSLERTANYSAGIVQDMSNKLWRTGSPFINQPLNLIRQKAFGNTDVSNLNQAIESFANEYARVLGGGVPAENSKEHARQLLGSQTTKEGIRQQVAILKREMKAKEQAADDTLQELRDRIKAGQYQTQAAPPGPTQPPAPATRMIGGRTFVKTGPGPNDWAEQEVTVPK